MSIVEISHSGLNLDCETASPGHYNKVQQGIWMHLCTWGSKLNAYAAVQSESHDKKWHGAEITSEIHALLTSYVSSRPSRYYFQSDAFKSCTPLTSVLVWTEEHLVCRKRSFFEDNPDDDISEINPRESTFISSMISYADQISTSKLM